MFDQAGGPTLILDEALSKYSAGRTEMAPGLDKSAYALFNSSYGDDSKEDGNGGSGRCVDYWKYLESGDGEGANSKGVDRQKAFSQFMNFVTTLFGHGNAVADSYDWNELGSVTVVDVRVLFYQVTGFTCTWSRWLTSTTQIIRSEGPEATTRFL